VKVGDYTIKEAAIGALSAKPKNPNKYVTKSDLETCSADVLFWFREDTLYAKTSKEADAIKGKYTYFVIKYLCDKPPKGSIRYTEARVEDNFCRLTDNWVELPVDCHSVGGKLFEFPTDVVRGKIEDNLAHKPGGLARGSLKIRSISGEILLVKALTYHSQLKLVDLSDRVRTEYTLEDTSEDASYNTKCGTIQPMREMRYVHRW
jgi:hypothetical protein